MNSLLFGIILFIFIGDRVNGVKIEFFKQSNFTDLHYESYSTAKCNNMPADKKDVNMYYIKTDTCLMVYFDPNCKSYYSRKFDLNNTYGLPWTVGSFHICNEDIGGPQLKIDITKWYDLSESAVLESYQDVCTCINVPQYVLNMTEWAINNYGNDFLAYYQPNCSENKWEAEHVAAGRWGPGSNWMHAYEKIDSVTDTTYKIQSISPDPNSTLFKTSCRPITINSQLRAKDEQLEKQIETILTLNHALKNTTVELKINQENHKKSLEDSIAKLRTDFSKDLQNYQQKQDQQFQPTSLSAKNEQLKNKMDTILTENQALKNKTVELESKLENHYKSFEDSLKKMKNDIRQIFA